MAVHWASTRLDVNKAQKFELTWGKGKLSNAKALEGLQSGIKALTAVRSGKSQ
jgi:hypothetical protein